MKKGFTLIELLIVIAIIAIIAGAVLVAINPARRIAEANDSSRWSEINSIANAVSQYIVDNAGDNHICKATDLSGSGDYCGDFDSSVNAAGYCAPTTTTDFPINSFIACPSYTGTGACQSVANLNAGTNTGLPGEFEDAACDLSLLVSEGYFTSVPTDPAMDMATASTSRYRIWREASGSICAQAVDASDYTDGGIMVCR